MKTQIQKIKKHFVDHQETYAQIGVITATTAGIALYVYAAVKAVDKANAEAAEQIAAINDAVAAGEGKLILTATGETIYVPKAQLQM